MSLKNIYDSASFRQAGHRLIDLLADHLQVAQSDNPGKVINWKSPEEELDFWKKMILPSSNRQAEKKEEVELDLFKTILNRSIHLHKPGYMGHQIAPTAPVSALASLLSGFLNNGMAVYEMGSAASALENIVINIIGKALGYDDNSSGMLTSGGTLANLTALLTARAIKSKTPIWDAGHSDEKLAIMVSEQAHYCIDRAAKIMGLGNKGILKIPVNNHFQIRTEVLDEIYDKAKESGFTVIAIVGSACSTATGSYDDLKEIGAFAKRRNIWMHVDSAHGGGVGFSPKYKSLLGGIDQADSVVIDCHKMMMTASVTTALIYKNGKDSYHTFNQQAAYLWENQEKEEWFNYGKRTFECTKLMLSIQFFSIIHTYGLQAIDEFVTTLYDLGKSFAALINKTNKIELLIAPQSNIVCFRFNPGKLSVSALSEINATIRQSILETGDFYIVQTNINGSIWLRVTLMNPITTTEHLRQLLQHVLSIGNQTESLSLDNV